MKSTYIPELKEENEIYEIKDEEFHHLKNVCRIKINEKVYGFNRDGLICESSIKEILKNKVVLKVDKFFKKKYNYRVHIGIPLIKFKNFSFILKSIQQLGIKKVYPFVSKFSIIDKINSKKIKRWNKIIIESAKQSGNFYLPLIEKVYKLEELSNFQGEKFVFYENSKNYINEKFFNEKKDSLILIGPEGGFSEDEVSFLNKNGFIDLKLKTNILRSEVAVITILTLIKFLKKEL